MKSKKVLFLMAVLTAMTVSVCGCGTKESISESDTEIAVMEETEQPTEDVLEETEETEQLQIEAEVTDTEEIATSQPEDSVTELSAVKYAKSTVNVRKGPSADTEKLGGLSTNQKVTVTGQAANGWYRIDFNGETGYVSDKYLVDEKVTTASAGSTDSGKTNSAGAAGNTGNEAPEQGDAGTAANGNTGSTGSGNVTSAGSTGTGGSSDAGNTGSTGTGGSSDGGNTGNTGTASGTADDTFQSEYENSTRGKTLYGEDAQQAIETGALEIGAVLNPDGSVTLP